MEWTTVAWIAIAVIAIFSMRRGCGGMTGSGSGGCGSGHHGAPRPDGSDNEDRKRN